jgi:hypothetical protein
MIAPAPARGVASKSSPASGLVFAAATDHAKAVSAFLIGLGLTVVTVESSDQPSAVLDALDGQPHATFAVFVGEAGAGEDGFGLGCCVGRLNRQRVCMMSPGSVDPASASLVHRIALDAAGAWQLSLARHLKSAGIDIDLNKLL